MDPNDLVAFVIILSLLNCNGAFVINEVSMKYEFVPGLFFFIDQVDYSYVNYILF